MYIYPFKELRIFSFTELVHIKSFENEREVWKWTNRGESLYFRSHEHITRGSSGLSDSFVHRSKFFRGVCHMQEQTFKDENYKYFHS